MATAALPSGADLSSVDLEKLMEHMTPGQGTKSPAPVPHPVKKTQERDFLASGNQGNVGAPTFKTKVPVKTQKGISFAGKHLSTKRYLGKGFPCGAPTDGPGPVYNPKFESGRVKGPLFMKASRRHKEAKSAGNKLAPGPKYEIPGTLGVQQTLTTSPAFKIGQAQRFVQNQYLSKSHAKSGPKGMDNQVGPASYQPDIAMQSSGPSFSFGGTFSSGGRRGSESSCNSSGGKKLLNASDPEGLVPPANVVNPEVTSKCRRAPQVKFAGGPFGSEQAKGRKPARAVSCSPGPGVYNPSWDSGKGKAPAFTFGMLSKAEKLYISADLTADTKGRDGPGPGYYPDMWPVQPSAPAYSFADPDPDTAQWKARFSSNRYIGAGIGMAAGRASPGPAVYDVPELPRGPAHTIASREKLLMKRICPAPERPRFISKELAKDNYGTYSPGPKYALPSTLDSNAGFTFSTADKEVGNQSMTSLDGKVLATPSEVRFISKEHALMNRGRYGPGPKYNLDDTVTRRLETVDAEGTVSSIVTRHTVQSRHRNPPAISFGSRPGSTVQTDPREYNPDDRITRKASPVFGFGSASRYGTGPVTQAEPSHARDVRPPAAHEKRHIDSSPGPGAFKPNFSSVDRHTPAISLGGLASISLESDARLPPPRAKTASPPPTADMGGGRG